MSGVRADEAHRFARTDRIVAAPRHPVDLSDPIEADNAFRIAIAWREFRRSATTPALRYQFFGSSHDAFEQGQMDTLDLLLVREGWRMSELAEALRVDPSTATRAVQRLVNDGLAERRQSTVRRPRRARLSERRGQATACGRCAVAASKPCAGSSAPSTPTSGRSSPVCSVASSMRSTDSPVSHPPRPGHLRASKSAKRGTSISIHDRAPPNRPRQPDRVAPRGVQRHLRRASDGVRAAALFGCAPYDAQPGRRRGSRAGDVPARRSAASTRSRRAPTFGRGCSAS